MSRNTTAIATLLTGLLMAAQVQAQTISQPAVGPSAPAPHVVPGTVEEQRAVSLLLSAYHELPSRAQFEAAARNPRPILLHVATNGSGPHAERAVEALFL